MMVINRGAKIMKYVFFVLLGASIGFFLQNLYNPHITLDKNQLMLKSHSLGACMNMHILKDNEMTRDIGDALGGYHQMINYYGYSDMVRVDDYVEKEYEKIVMVSKFTNKPLIFMACMKVYNSKEFDKFILNLVPAIEKG